MEQKLNSIPPDGAAAQQRYEAELTSSSQTIAKPIVVGSVSNLSQSQIKNEIENDFDEDCDDDDAYEDYMENYIEETLRNCSCGAYQLGDNGQLYKVADCCC